MIQKTRKATLLFCLTALLGLGQSVEAYAGEGASPSPQPVTQQAKKKISGVVRDAQGPVIGASVQEKGTSNGCVTDLEGNFSMSVAPGATIVVSYIGYTTQEIKVGNQSTVSVSLKEDSQSLDELVVVGYGVQKKKLVTGATVEVKGEDIAKLNTTQVLTALQSQSPGVNIQAISGQPGDGFKVNIRGAGTNGNANPIYVIDGVAGGDINALNPSDIERIDVLKDAASCAIYGASAANGVILVTTKQGKAGKVSVNYDGNIGWQNVYKRPQMLTAKQYMQVMDQVNFNAGRSPYDWSKYMPQELLDSYMSGENPGTDWMEEMRNKNAIVTNHSLSVSGGSDMSKFSTGIGYQYQDGIMGKAVKSDFRRFTFRLNSEHVIYRDSKGTDVVKFGENLYYQHRQNQGVQLGTQYANDLSNALRANPCIPVRNADGDYYTYDDLKQSGWFDYNPYSGNPIANQIYNQAGNNRSKSYNMKAVAYIEVQPIKNLIYRGQVSYHQESSSWRCYLPEYRINDMNDSRTGDIVTDNTGVGWGWNMTNTLNYKFDVAKDHHFDVLAGTEWSRTDPDYGESVNVTSGGNIFGDFKHAYISNTINRTAAQASGTPYTQSRALSFFGRVNYDFNETYMLTAIIRADGSSNFAKGNRWGYFPSVSAGWVVTNENFMKDTSSWLDFLKIRAGWGQNGNSNVSAFQYLAGFDLGDYGLYSFNNEKNTFTQGAYPNRLPNDELTWETSEQINIGFDARFLGGRLGLTFDWYNKKTKDLLLAVEVPATSGFATKFANAGTVKNTGVEVALNWRDKIGKDVNYGVNFNIAANKNKVTSVNNANHYINAGNDLLAQSVGYAARMWQGHAIGCFYGFKTDGVMQNAADVQNYLDKNCGGLAENSLQGATIQPGDLKFVDTDGNGIIYDDDKVDLGNPHPKMTMGLGFNVEYKGFDLNVSTYGAFGQKVARSWRKFTDGQWENYTTEVYSYWHGEGTSNRYPRLAPGNLGVNFQKVSDIYVDNAGYFRLQNLTIGYDFKQLIKNCPFQQLRLYFAAQNLFTITGYKGMDPENGMAINSDEPYVTGFDVGNYPQPRTYMVGVNIKF